MKKLLFGSMLGCIMFASCSKEDLSVDDKNESPSFMIQNSDVDVFLNDFYPGEFVFGDFVDIDSLGYRISEVIVGDDEMARGYIVQDNSGTFLYFLDVDRDNFISTTYDVISEMEDVFNNINEQEMYSLTNEFDVIGFLGGEYEDPAEWSGRPFIGYGYSYGPCDPIFNRQTVHRQHYFFWIKNGPSEPLPFRPC